MVFVANHQRLLHRQTLQARDRGQPSLRAHSPSLRAKRGNPVPAPPSPLDRRVASSSR
jgi:hypothetical protein